MGEYKFSLNSLKRLNTCNSKIKVLMRSALKTSPVDFTIGCGHRSEEEQMEAFYKGFSRARYGQSKHNVYPSKAIDIYPYVMGRMCNGSKKGDREEFEKLASHIKDVADKLHIKIDWGGDWENFKDYPHWELAEGE